MERHEEDTNSRLVIVTSGAPAAEANRLATLNPALETATWYADEGARLAAALQIQESPLVLAIHDRGIQWTLAGVLSGSKRMQDVLTAWVKIPATARASRPLPPVAQQWPARGRPRRTCRTVA